MKIAYCCVINDPWKSVIKNLTSLGYEASLIITWRDFLNDFDNIKKDEILSVEHCWQHVNLDTTSYISSDIREEYILLAIKMYDRQDPFNKISVEHRKRIYLSYIKYWIEKLNGTELVIFPQIPHRFFDFALFNAAQELGIQCLFLQITALGSRTIPTESIPKMSQLGPTNVSMSESFNVKEFIEKYRGDYEKAKPSYVKRNEKNTSLLGLLRVYFAKARNSFEKREYNKFIKPNSYYVYCEKQGEPVYIQNWGQLFLFTVRKNLRNYQIKKSHDRLVQPIQMNTPFIFFALHYQPEETSVPSAGSFADQLYVIRLLDEYLPSHFKIYVREHSAQFKWNSEGVAARDSAYYQRLKKISDRVVLTDPKLDIYGLIDKSEFVVTLTGTIGFEAALRNKNVLTFGRCWYEGLSNVYKVCSVAALQPTVEKCVNNVPIKIAEAEINEFLQRSIAAIHYKPYTFNNDVSYGDSEKNLTAFIENYVKKNSL